MERLSIRSRDNPAFSSTRVEATFSMSQVAQTRQIDGIDIAHRTIAVAASVA